MNGLMEKEERDGLRRQQWLAYEGNKGQARCPGHVTRAVTRALVLGPMFCHFLEIHSTLSLTNHIADPARKGHICRKKIGCFSHINVEQ